MFTTCLVRFEKLSGWHEVLVRGSEEGIKIDRSLGVLGVNYPELTGSSVVRLLSEVNEPTAWDRAAAYAAGKAL